MREYNARWRWVFSSRSSAKLSPLPPLTWLKKAGSSLLALLFPDDCRVCGEPLQGLTSVPVCPACLHAPAALLPEHFCLRCRTPFLNARPLNQDGVCRLCEAGLTRFDAAYSFGDYSAELRALIHLFKYSRMRPLARPLGRLLAQALPRDERFDVVTPLPLHWRKLLVRGFNQSRLLAAELARRTGLPVEDLLRRPRNTPAQAGLTGTARRRNMRGAFEARRPDRIAGRCILLIDDVLTTGATVNAAADALKRAGAARVCVLTLARPDRAADRRAGPPAAAEPDPDALRGVSA